MGTILAAFLFIFMGSHIMYFKYKLCYNISVYLRKENRKHARWKKYEDLRIRVPKGKKEIIKEYVKSVGESLNSFVNNAIDEKMERDKN